MHFFRKKKLDTRLINLDTDFIHLDTDFIQLDTELIRTPFQQGIYSVTLLSVCHTILAMYSVENYLSTWVLLKCLFGTAHFLKYSIKLF